jgi:hypothetical protein
MVACLLAAAVLPGCAPSRESDAALTDADAVMEFAESLEADSLLDQATAQYAIIAEQFPTAEVYPLAVRRVAFLYAHPDNPARNDTLALRWMRIYQPLARTREERQEVGVVTSLILQTMLLREQLARAAAAGDSLGGVARRQTRRVRDLENDLQQVNDELRKLKEVDVRTSRTRRK